MEELKMLVDQLKIQVDGMNSIIKEMIKRTENAGMPEYDTWEQGCLNSSEWKEYIQFRANKKKPLSTGPGVKRALNKLRTLSKGNKDVAIRVLHQSIDNGWQGLFPLRSE